ncbi:MAG TPA: peroxiredoxin [Polyangiales bacterium]|nr:peroxiredoxin [Polyangiales bacterium]
MSSPDARKLAPSFTAEASTGGRVSLESYRGKYVVVYFYPKSFTLFCTRETIAFRDAASELRALGAEVIGISTDPLDTQCKFAEHYQTSFPILSDPDGAIAREYGVMFPVLPRVKRVTFIIDPEGRIAARFHHEVMWHKHIDDALEFLRAQKPG